jgi:predicted porin
MWSFHAAAASAAVVMLGGGVACAADLNTKAPALPAAGPAACVSIVDFFTTACQLAAYGVRIYGTIDIGGSYQTNGAATDRNFPNGLTWYPQKMNYGAKWLFSPNGSSVSNVGILVSEPLGAGWSFVGQLETQFDPYSFNLSNGIESLHNVLGVSLANATGVSDSSVNNKFYNSLGYAGFSNDTWGTLTFLRQSSLTRDALIAYDSVGGYAFSLVAATGALGGGGDTENGRATTSVKYRVNIGDYRLGVFGQFGGYDEGNASRGAIQGQVGGDFRVGPGILSVDAVAGYTKDAVSESLSWGVLSNGLGSPASKPTLSATISDNTSVVAVAKYTVDRLKLSGGYEWIQFANPSDPQTSFTDLSGYAIGGTSGISIKNTSYNTNRILQVAWVGARYSVTSSVDVAAGYYHYWQNDYSGGLGSTSAGDSGLKCVQSSLAQSSCAGAQDAFTAVIDWRFAPKWDTYLGTMYTRLNGGLDAGYLAKDNWATTVGVRFRW